MELTRLQLSGKNLESGESRGICVVRENCPNINSNSLVTLLPTLLNPVTNMGCTSVNIGVSANLELVDKFCYFGDTLSVDGDADAAVETTV